MLATTTIYRKSPSQKEIPPLVGVMYIIDGSGVLTLTLYQTSILFSEYCHKYNIMLEP